MPQVDFYILQGMAQNGKERFIAQLTEQIWQNGYRIYLQTDSIAYATQLDEWLWTYSQESFLPHDVYPSTQPSIAAIRIGYTEQPCPDMQVLINVLSVVPACHTQFNWIIEIVPDTPPERDAGRNRYRFYRGQSYDLKTHEIRR